MATRKPKGLGRGLDALLGEDKPAIENFGRTDTPDRLPSSLKLNVLRAGKYQPRPRMDEGALNELAASIRTQGALQPILGLPLTGKVEGKYEIIAGERRCRASNKIGIPSCQEMRVQ